MNWLNLENPVSKRNRISYEIKNQIYRNFADMRVKNTIFGT